MRGRRFSFSGGICLLALLLAPWAGAQGQTGGYIEGSYKLPGELPVWDWNEAGPSVMTLTASASSAAGDSAAYDVLITPGHLTPSGRPELGWFQQLVVDPANIDQGDYALSYNGWVWDQQYGVTNTLVMTGTTAALVDFDLSGRLFVDPSAPPSSGASVELELFYTPEQGEYQSIFAASAVIEADAAPVVTGTLEVTDLGGGEWEVSTSGLLTVTTEVNTFPYVGTNIYAGVSVEAGVLTATAPVTVTADFSDSLTLNLLPVDPDVTITTIPVSEPAALGSLVALTVLAALSRLPRRRAR